VRSATIDEQVTTRQYEELETFADAFIKNDGWDNFVRQLKNAGSSGKARDALVSLLQMKAVGGTDSDIFKEFAQLEGETLNDVRAEALQHSMSLLSQQIENRHTYFLDVDAMATTPYAILVKDVIEARKRELEQLDGNPSRIELLGTYYGFTILMVDGSKPYERSSNQGYYYWRRRTYLDENLSETSISALQELTGELANAVDIDKTYRTLGTTRVFRSKCAKTTAQILADGVRLTLYKAPGNRGTAARALGKTEDSRALSFLHHRLPLEQNRHVRISIINSLGKIGHESSIDILKEHTGGRYLHKQGEAVIEALGKIHSPQCRETLIYLVQNGRNTTRAAAIRALSEQNMEGLVEFLTPYLTHKSRPVSRSSVLALASLGEQGEAAISEKAPTIIKRIGSDRPSRTAIDAMLRISSVAKQNAVHEYFAKRIDSLVNDVKRWTRSASTQRYTYYWGRWERRARQSLVDYIQLASRLKPPFADELLKSVRTALNVDDQQQRMKQKLMHSQLGKSVLPWTTRVVQEKSFLSAYR